MSDLVNENMGPKIWFVTQGATFRKGRGMNYLWAPEKGKDNKGRFFWENVFKVKKGDIIFNYSEGELKGVSIAKNDGHKAANRDMESPWGPNGFRVDIDLVMLNPGISSDIFTKNVDVFNKYLSSINNKPFSSNGSINQGYLYEFSKEGGKFLREIYGKPFGNDYIDEFFDKIELQEIKTSEPLNKEFNHRYLISSIADSNLFFNTSLIIRLIGSLQTKPFLILTGLSGSGKTKLAQAFALWICQSKNQFKIVPVGADWTNREPLLGYPNSLESNNYVKPDNGVLDLLLDASQEENKNKPHFLILDEMNLSHVERYFADFLSVMESGDAIKLYSGISRKSTDGTAIPQEITWPKNLFIIGTVNIDETTYMFSPKVLDRANVIEFRITEDELSDYLDSAGELNLKGIEGKGSGMGSDFVRLALERNYPFDHTDQLNEALLEFFKELKKTGAEFGYRTASEIKRFVGIAKKLDPAWDLDEIIDAAIMQKLLPKLHGSRSKLVSVLTSLAKLCIEDATKIDIKKDLFEAYDKEGFASGLKIKYSISLEKICRMHKNVIANGFTSYAEA